MQPRLVIISGCSQGKVELLLGDKISIGRDSTNQICVIDPAVSRRHCLLTSVDGGYEIADLDSHNGTFVNGVPVQRKQLQNGDTIRMGTCELVFLLSEDEVTSASEAELIGTPATFSLKTVHLEQPMEHPVGRMARDLEALFRISNAINSIRELVPLQQELLRLAFEAIPAENAAILLLTNPDDREPTSVCTWHRQGDSGEPVQIQSELVQRTLWECSAIVSSAGPDSSASQSLCVPLVGVDRTIGVVYLNSPASAPPFAEDHIHFTTSVSRIAAVTLENVLALDALRAENQRLKTELVLETNLIGESRQIKQVEASIARVSQSDATVLIRGESGTGKELVARAIHQNSPRNGKPFVAINCAAIPEALLESELFGHEKGAFTGAVAAKKGKLEAAEDGTVFLDEIGELAPLLQAKLLRALQEREFERLGGTRSLVFKGRVVTATNKNLEDAIKSGEFRRDLYYRLNVVSIPLPPLREHREDVPLLALYFATKYAAKCKRAFKGISREARFLLVNYSWPGNVRELQNAIEHAIVMGLTEEILPEDLPPALLEEQGDQVAGSRYHHTVNRIKKQLIVDAVRETKGSYTEAAKLLGLHPKYLHRLAKNLNLKSELRPKDED